LATATLGELPKSVMVSRDWPQGGVLSPLLWCLVVDKLLSRLNGGGVCTQVYVEDMSSSSGKIPKYGIRDHTMGPSYYRNMV